MAHQKPRHRSVPAPCRPMSATWRWQRAVRSGGASYARRGNRRDPPNALTRADDGPGRVGCDPRQFLPAPVRAGDAASQLDVWRPGQGVGRAPLHRLFGSLANAAPPPAPRQVGPPQCVPPRRREAKKIPGMLRSGDRRGRRHGAAPTDAQKSPRRSRHIEFVLKSGSFHPWPSAPGEVDVPLHDRARRCAAD